MSFAAEGVRLSADKLRRLASEPVLVPGDPERIAREERGRTGIAVDATTWEELMDAGEKVGLTHAQTQALIA